MKKDSPRTYAIILFVIVLIMLIYIVYNKFIKKDIVMDIGNENTLVMLSFNDNDKLVLNDDNTYTFNYVKGTEKIQDKGEYTKKEDQYILTKDISVELINDNVGIIRGLNDVDENIGVLKNKILFKKEDIESIKDSLNKDFQELLSGYYNGEEHAKSTNYTLVELGNCINYDNAKEVYCETTYEIEFEGYSKEDCENNPDKYSREQAATCNDKGISSSYIFQIGVYDLKAINLASING